MSVSKNFIKKGIRRDHEDPSLIVCEYLSRCNYLNVSDILKHLENLENYGCLDDDVLDAIYRFYDRYADELFIHPRNFLLKSDRRERSMQNQQILPFYNRSSACKI
jgi:hypothetical protein